MKLGLFSFGVVYINYSQQRYSKLYKRIEQRGHTWEADYVPRYPLLTRSVGVNRYCF